MKSPEPNHSKLYLRAVIVITAAALAMPCFAQVNGPKTESPYFFVISSDPGTDQLPLKRTWAEVAITGVIADVVINQEYKNEGKSPLEAIYTFPASSNAAIYAMEMTVGNRKIIARIEEKQKARDQYEQARSEGKRTSLLEQHRPNVFQMNVANIMPGDIIKVTLRYTELLVPEEGTYRFIYPTVVGPRYSGEGGDSGAFVSTPYQREGELASYGFDMSLTLSTGMPIQHIASVTHKIQTEYLTPDKANITIAEGKDAGNRDFILEYKLAGDRIESGLMLYEHNDENFFLLMVQPPKRIVKEALPPREYIFIVDVSGSMRGFPITVTKTLLRNLIINLRPVDRFNVLVFESGSYWLADESLPALEENISRATAFLDRQHGGGGTNLLAAMKKAAAFPRCESGLSRSFIVVTDGYVNVEREVFDMIRTTANEANVFAFGIGTSVNRYLIEGMAHVGMSEPFIVLGSEGADREADKFRKYINHPVLTGLASTFSGFEAYDVEPASLPDVLAERPVILFGKYKGKPKGTITLKGTAGNNAYTRTFNLRDVKADESHAAIRYLWARKKIQLLDDYNNLGYGSEWQEEVTALGLKYGLMTAYTSFVAIEEQVVNNEKELTTVKQPLPLPQGVPNSAVGFEVEIEEDDISFSFHKEIELLVEADEATKAQIIKSIEATLIPVLNQYLDDNSIDVELVEVTVDGQGRVTDVSVKGQGISREVKEAIQSIIMKHYVVCKLKRTWMFKITF